MKMIIRLCLVTLLFSLVTYPIYAHPHQTSGNSISISYDYYITPNSGNNYDNGQGVSARFEHPIYGNLSGIVEGSHITDIHFPVIDDPKGSWGELRGYGASYLIKLELPINNRVIPYVVGGVGVYHWEFKENPLLQTLGIEVDTDTSLMLQSAVGVEVVISDSWTVFSEAGWLDTSIGKSISQNSHGIEGILDSGDIGLQYIYIKVGGKYEF